MSRVNRPLLLAGACAVALAGAAVAGVVAHASSSTTKITVKEREYHFTLSSRKAAAGPVTLLVKNTGKISHQLEIAGPGLKKKMALLRPGNTATLRVTLKAGKYTIWCAVPGHAQLGMKTTLTGIATASGGSAGSTTSSGGGSSSAWG